MRFLPEIAYLAGGFMLAQQISRVRRNHGLEHATIHVLSEKHKNFSAQGNSNHKGFSLNIYGNISENDVADAVEEAYSRMKKGEHHLAVHPNCGTVLLTTATMAAVTAQATFSLEQRRQKQSKMGWSVLLNALPTAVLAVVVALIISKPVGVHLQAKYTVEGDLKEMELLSVRPVQPSAVTRLFQLLLTGGSQPNARSYRIETIN
jgi:Trk-type K+ transport system membrane component